jgi:regulator of replication initiation timing
MGAAMMEPTNPAELAKVRNEHCNRLYERYERKARSLQQLSRALVLFALVYLVFILFPYVLVHRESRRVEAKLERLRSLAARVGELQSRYEAYSRAEAGIEQLQGSIREGAEALREAIGQLGEDEPGRGLAPEDPCPPDPPEQRLDCQAREQLFGQFREHLALLEREVAAPLEAEKPELELEASFERVLAGRPTLWTPVQEGGRSSAQVDEAAWRRFWQEQLMQIRKEAGRLKTELEALKKQLGTLEKEQAQLELQQKEILERQSRLQERLDGLESPLGRLPLGLDESLQAFPALLAVGFLICARQLRDALRLRRGFHGLYLSRDGTGQVLTDEQVALVAPLPIDPADPEQGWIERCAILFLPFVVFAASVTLIVYTWRIGRTAPVLGATHLWYFGGLYGLCLVLFVFGCGQVVIELRRYWQELPRPRRANRGDPGWPAG